MYVVYETNNSEKEISEIVCLKSFALYLILLTFENTKFNFVFQINFKGLKLEHSMNPFALPLPFNSENENQLKIGGGVVNLIYSFTLLFHFHICVPFFVYSTKFKYFFNLLLKYICFLAPIRVLGETVSKRETLTKNLRNSLIEGLRRDYLIKSIKNV